MEITKEELDIFKKIIIKIAKEEYYSCDLFTDRINDSDSLDNVVYIFEHFIDDIYEKLGGTDYQYEIDELEDNVRSLESEIEYLERQLETNLVVDTIHDEMKLNTFIEFHSKYTPWEFEELLKNGKL